MSGPGTVATIAADRPFPAPDVRHASAVAAGVLTAYHRAKWDHDLDAWLAHFADDGRYADATLGWYRQNPQELRRQLGTRIGDWGDGRAWATSIMGGDSGAIVAVTDDPQLFGGEIRALSAVLLRAGRVIRFVDYWDSRHFGTSSAARLRTPDHAFPAEIETPDSRARPDAALDRICRRVHRGLLENDVDAVTGLLADDAVWEDLTLHSRFVGRDAVGRYLRRCGGRQPYADDTRIVNVLGGPLGGGWEWCAAGGPVRNGVVAVSLDDRGAIVRVTALWDGGRLTDATIADMVAWSIEPSR